MQNEILSDQGIQKKQQQVFKMHGQSSQLSNKSSGISLVVLIVLGILVLAGAISIGLYILTKNKRKEDDIPIITTTTPEDDINAETGDVNNDSGIQEGEITFFEYIWYEDEYIKFQYPKEWNVTINTDKDPIIYNSTYENNEKNQAKGVQRIDIKFEDIYTLLMTIPSKNNNIYSFEHGWDKYTYYFNKPNEIEWSADVMFEGPQYHELTKSPLIFVTEKYDILLALFSREDRDLLLLGEEFEDKYIGHVPLIREFDFMAVDENGENIVTSIDITCPTDTKEEFDICSEFLNQFFKTVEKK
jgi:hypothetical protein